MSSGLSADGGGGSGGFTLFLGFELAGLLCRRASNVSTLTAVCIDKHTLSTDIVSNAKSVEFDNCYATSTLIRASYE